MTHIMRLLSGPLFIVLMATLAMAQIRVEPVALMPAWCGGSYHISGALADKEYIEMVKAGQAVPSGTNFGPCEDVVKKVRSLDGNVKEVRIPTYPAVPAPQVNFEADGRVRHYTGEVDQDGKAVVQELKLLPDIPK
jgi:hypothetical protein